MTAGFFAFPLDSRCLLNLADNHQLGVSLPLHCKYCHVSMKEIKETNKSKSSPLENDFIISISQ